MSRLPIVKCTGCTACASICPQNCINMVSNEEGFLYPSIDIEKCTNCGLCEEICPLIKPLTKDEFEPKAYAAYSVDEEIRLESSSGGIFSEIAKFVLNNDGCVYGAAYNDNFDVVHICVDNENELYKLRGAKYAQSDLGNIFNDIKLKLDGGKLVLFSGTPCQVAGLKAFLGNEYTNLIMVDFICHSVPSPKVWKEYVKYRASKDNEGKLPIRINLRSKETGWSRYKYSNRFEYDNGVVNSCPNSESVYMKLFVGGYISRKSCTDCHFKGYKRDGDITIGDFWGIWDIAPEIDDNKGTSAVVIQTQKGESIFKKISEYLILKEVSLEDISRQNPAILMSSKCNEKKQDILTIIETEDFENCTKYMGIPNKSIKKTVIKFLKKIF